MADKFLLKDHLFNADTVAQLAQEYAVLPGFDPAAFRADTLAGFPERELMARLEWIADCLEPYLAPDFPSMADQLERAMPPPLDPARSDDDFGQFIHAVPGILAVRHGLADHRDSALDLLHAATQRFSMEFYIRAFLNRWPEQTLARMALWAKDDNYHVRRLVSEGTRPRLPWARAVSLPEDAVWPLLDVLHADPTRYVTRSVANHLNDLSKTSADQVLARLSSWRDAGVQQTAELAWMTRHALRTLIKQGNPGAMAALGYRNDVKVDAALHVATPLVQIGDVLRFDATLSAQQDLPVLVDYRIVFARPQGKTAQKVFKLKTTSLSAGKSLKISKNHRLKGNATTFTLHPGTHEIILQVNGRDAARARFDLT